MGLTRVLVVSQGAAAPLPRALRPPSVTPRGQEPPAPRSKWGTPVCTDGFGIFGKVFTSSYYFHSRRSATSQWQSAYSKAAKVPFTGIPRLALLLFGVFHEHGSPVALPGALLQRSPELQFRHSTDNGTPERMWPYLRALAVVGKWVFKVLKNKTTKQQCDISGFFFFKKDILVINTVAARARWALSQVSTGHFKNSKYWQHASYTKLLWADAKCQRALKTPCIYTPLLREL